MSTPGNTPLPASPGDPREFGAPLAMRIIALVRTGRSYNIGNQAFTAQLDQLLQVLQPAFRALGRLELLDYQGDLHLNGVRLPLRGANLKLFEQLQQEFHARQIAGLVIEPGIEMAELEAFMRLFMSSELYKGESFLQSCVSHGITRLLPALVVEEEASDEDSPADADRLLHEAMRAYNRALRSASILLGRAGLSGALELRHLRRITQPLVDEALTERWQAVPLGTLRHDRQRGHAHAIHTCIVAVSIGRHLGLARRSLADLGVAALLHDLGKDAVAPRLQQPMETWGDDEWAQARRHPVEGLKRIARACPLTAPTLAAMRVALEHHATSAAGYPALGPDHRVSGPSAIVSIADAFVSLLSHRSRPAARLTPHEALGLVLGPLGSAFEPALRAALVRSVGLYPPGQVVELDDRSLARVLAVDPEAPERPIVALVRDAEGTRVEDGTPIGHLPAERSVRRALPMAEWPEETLDAA